MTRAAAAATVLPVPSAVDNVLSLGATTTMTATTTTAEDTAPSTLSSWTAETDACTTITTETTETTETTTNETDLEEQGRHPEGGSSPNDDCLANEDEGRQRRRRPWNILTEACPHITGCTMVLAIISMANVQMVAWMPKRSVPLTIIFALLLAALLAVIWVVQSRPMEWDDETATFFVILTGLGVIQLSILTEHPNLLWALYAPGIGLAVIVLAVLLRVVAVGRAPFGH